jgi:hypothetical protein
MIFTRVIPSFAVQYFISRIDHDDVYHFNRKGNRTRLKDRRTRVRFPDWFMPRGPRAKAPTCVAPKASKRASPLHSKVLFTKVSEIDPHTVLTYLGHGMSRGVDFEVFQ